jgi:hypothetical protein
MFLRQHKKTKIVEKHTTWFFLIPTLGAKIDPIPRGDFGS